MKLKQKTQKRDVARMKVKTRPGGSTTMPKPKPAKNSKTEAGSNDEAS